MISETLFKIFMLYVGDKHILVIDKGDWWCTWARLFRFYRGYWAYPAASWYSKFVVEVLVIEIWKLLFNRKELRFDISEVKRILAYQNEVYETWIKAGSVSNWWGHYQVCYICRWILVSLLQMLYWGRCVLCVCERERDINAPFFFFYFCIWIWIPPR